MTGDLLRPHTVCAEADAGTVTGTYGSGMRRLMRSEWQQVFELFRHPEAHQAGDQHRPASTL